MKFLKAKLKWKEYKAYPKKIIFKAKSNSSGIIKISKTLKQFCYLNFIYIKIKNKTKKFKIKTYYDRGSLCYKSYVRYKTKNFNVYLKTTPRFRNILIKALNSKADILKKYKNLNFRLYINDEGKLLLRFLVNLSSKNKHNLNNLLNKRQKTITLKTYLKFIKKFNINTKNISPFIKNYYVKEIKIPESLKKTKISNPHIFRLIGLINGDGTLTKYGAYFYGDDKILHQDFKELSLSLNKDLDIKTYKKIKTTFKSYWYSRKLVINLNKMGAIYNRKLDFIDAFKIDKDVLAYSEYLSGIYDTEGTLIKDSNIVIPTGVTIYNKNINILNKDELKDLFLLAKNQGIFKYLRDTGSEYYKLGLNKLKHNKKYILILKKLKNHYPGLALSHKKILDDLNIDSKLELKNIHVNLKTNTITAMWWIKINLIKDVIKFASIINPHIDRKRQKLNEFISNYITTEDLKEIRSFIHKNGN